MNSRLNAIRLNSFNWYSAFQTLKDAFTVEGGDLTHHHRDQKKKRRSQKKDAPQPVRLFFVIVFFFSDRFFFFCLPERETEKQSYEIAGGYWSVVGEEYLTFSPSLITTSTCGAPPASALTTGGNNNATCRSLSSPSVRSTKALKSQRQINIYKTQHVPLVTIHEHH